MVPATRLTVVAAVAEFWLIKLKSLYWVPVLFALQRMNPTLGAAWKTRIIGFGRLTLRVGTRLLRLQLLLGL